jgi:cystathionine beta-synthase
VVVFHDHGMRYLGKMYDDVWMRAKGFLEITGMTARDLVAMGVSGELCAVKASQPIDVAIRVMGEPTSRRSR